MRQGGSESPTALEFEFGDPMGEQLVFDNIEPMPKVKPEEIVEIDLSGLPEKEEAVPEFSIPETFEVDEKYNTSTFISDPLQLSPTYMPRFTDASERYRMTATMKQNGDRLRPTAEEKPTEPAEDPIAEIDEGKEAPHVVITQAPEEDATVRDDSIRILKFEENEKPVDETDPIEEEVRALTDVVKDAVRPKAVDEVAGEEPEASEAPVDEPEPEPEEEKPELTIPDPFVDITLVDYNSEDDESESLSREEAPSDGKKKQRRGEFTDPSMQDSVKDRFLDSLMSVKIRLVGSLVLLAVMLAVDIAKLFSVDVFGMIGIGHLPYAAAIIDLQFSICLFLLALPEVIRAVGNLFSKVFSPELALVVSLCAVAVNSIAVTASSAISYSTFGVLFGIQTVLAIIASYHRVSADYTAFGIISKNTVKGILDKRLTRTLPRENIALDGAVDEYKSKIARMFRAAFISDFYAHTSVPVENTFNNILMLLLSLGVSVTTAIIAWVVGTGSIADFTGAFAFVFLLSYPAVSMLVHKLPHHVSSLEVKDESSAFVGEASLYACSDIDVLAYNDTEIFGVEDVSIKKVHLYGKAYNASKAMEQMYAIFSTVGGPLKEMFHAAVGDISIYASDIVIEDDGISATLDGHAIAAGTIEYMKRHGMTIPEDDHKTNPPAGDSKKVMYGAEDGEVYVKFFIRYSFSEEFTMLLPGLRAKGIVPLIYTRDPNLTLEFFRMLTLGEDMIRIMKKHSVPLSEDRVYRRVSAGIVTLGDKLNAINMVILAKKYTAFQSELAICEMIAMLAGAAVAVLFALTGSLSIPSVALATLQVAWCIYLYLRTRHSFKHKKGKGKR